MKYHFNVSSDYDNNWSLEVAASSSHRGKNSGAKIKKTLLTQYALKRDKRALMKLSSFVYKNGASLYTAKVPTAVTLDPWTNGSICYTCEQYGMCKPSLKDVNVVRGMRKDGMTCVHHCMSYHKVKQK